MLQIVNDLFGLAKRATEALETIADNSKKIAETNEKCMTIIKKVTEATQTLIEKAPDDIKEEEGFQMTVEYVNAIADAVKDL